MASDAVVDSPERLGEAFHDAGWLSRNPLTGDTILQYFAVSPFYSKDSINERSRQSFLDSSQAALLTGIEYRLRAGWESTPGLFVIERVLRKRSGTAIHHQVSTAVLSVYYCLAGVIYQCPDLATLLSARIERASFHLAAAMEAYEAARGGTSAGGAAEATTTAGASQAALARITYDPRVDDLLRFSAPV